MRLRFSEISAVEEIIILVHREVAYGADIGSMLTVPRTSGQISFCGLGPKRDSASVFHLTGIVLYFTLVMYCFSCIPRWCPFVPSLFIA